MDFSQFHFAQGAWLWGLLAVPIVTLLYAASYKAEGAQLLERFADRHLLPHLLKKRGGTGRNIRIPILLWALAWSCGVVAMAGPRWNYTDEQTFRVPQDLVIVLDLSQSMNANDVKPSRVARAREEIEDLLDMSRGTSIGLVAYAAVPHMVTPLTDDVRTIRNLLPALDTSLVTIQGDRLKPALEMAASMLKAEPGNNKSILVISDGGFQESDFAGLAQAAGNAAIYTMGVGVASAPAPGDDDGTVKNGEATNLRADRLQMLAAAGHGLYIEANYTDSDTRAVLSRIEAANGKAQAAAKSVRVWQERFYIPALLLALLLLPLFRRGAVFPVVALLAMTFVPTGHARAATAAELFLNRDQQARAAYDSGDYKGAMTKFRTPYQRGVVAYRTGAYAKAASLFKAAAGQKGDLDALYDLGNAQLMQGQVEDSIASYEAVLKQTPGDVGARHNLAIAMKMLAQKQQQKKQQPKDQQDKNRQNKDSGQNKQNKQPGKSGQQGQQDGARNPSQPAKQESPQQAKQSKGDQQAAKQKEQQGGPGKTQQGARQQPTSPGQSAPQGEKQRGQAQQSMRYGEAGKALQRTQRDVNADEWLSRVQSDPGSFLKNQFMIEDRESGLQQGTPP